MNTAEWYVSATGAPEGTSQGDIPKHHILKYTTLRYHPKEDSSWHTQNMISYNTICFPVLTEWQTTCKL